MMAKTALELTHAEQMAYHPSAVIEQRKQALLLWWMAQNRQGENWRQALLQQIAAKAPGLRPAVISSATLEQLDEYRGFRHVARHHYTFNLDPAKIELLVSKALLLFAQVQAELLAFADFLDQQA